MYIAKNIDPERFVEALKSSVEHRSQRMDVAIERERAFFEGFRACADSVEGMFHCSNYEDNQRILATQRDGTKLAALSAATALGLDIALNDDMAPVDMVLAIVKAALDKQRQ